jgi:TPR repeat protein
MHWPDVIETVTVLKKMPIKLSNFTKLPAKKIMVTSCYALASMYINGAGVNVDYTYAGQLFEKSCIQEFPSACQIVEKIKKINQDNAP